jgi:hypothetical protein
VVTLDFSFGDPGEVEEIRYPEILGGAGIVLHAYPIERILAEKIATMMERGELNTRDRDFADVWVLSRIHTIAAAALRSTLHADRHSIIAVDEQSDMRCCLELDIDNSIEGLARGTLVLEGLDQVAGTVKDRVLHGSRLHMNEPDAGGRTVALPPT